MEPEMLQEILCALNESGRSPYLPDLRLTPICDKVESAARIVEEPTLSIPALASAIRRIWYAEELAEEAGVRSLWQRVTWFFGRDQDPLDVLPDLDVRERAQVIQAILDMRDAVRERFWRRPAKVG